MTNIGWSPRDFLIGDTGGVNAAGAAAGGEAGGRAASGSTGAPGGAIAPTGADGRANGMIGAAVATPGGVGVEARVAAFCMALLTASNNCAGVVLAFIKHWSAPARQALSTRFV